VTPRRDDGHHDDRCDEPDDDSRKVVITGITGTLGAALGRACRARGHEVVGASRRPFDKPELCDVAVANEQRTAADARALLAHDPDWLLLCAGQIESEVGEGGMPLAEQAEAIYRVNAVFPSLLAIEAARATRRRPLDVVAVGSIADGSPSCFGPVYHASKIALHHFWTGTAPIAAAAKPPVRLRLYRPGAIRGPLAWAPVLRLNERGRRIRARRCEGAPEAGRVADAVLRFVEGDRAVGTWDEPLSFRALKLLFAMAPDLYARLQHVAWRKGSRFAG